MSDEKKVLAEAMALRYMDLAGVNNVNVNEEVSPEFVEKLYEPREDVTSGGDNLHHDIDHVDVVADESNVAGVEVQDLHTGEVEVTDIDIEKIAESVRNQLIEEGFYSSED
jgi:hypothetical protein